MKTKKIFNILLILLIILTTTVMGYETDTFKVTINENYEQKLEENLIMFRNTETGDNIVIQELEQKVTGGKLSTYQLNSISEEITSQYKDLYDAEVEQTGKEELSINNRNVTKMTFKITLEGATIEQELNIFVTSNKVYDVIFTSISEGGFTQEEKDSVLNSFEVFEVEQETDEIIDAQTNNTLWILIGIVILVVIIIIIQKKRNGKAEKTTEIEVKKDEK